MERMLVMAYNLWIQLHECAGHASGRSLPSVSHSSLGANYNIIEECRADLVAMYFIGDRHLCRKILTNAAPDITDVEHFIKVAYAQYLTDGSLFQLTRIPAEAKEIEATHFRNRQINATVVIEKAMALGGLHFEDGPYGRVLIINDVDTVRAAFAEVLSEIQRIKSTGDKESAAFFVDNYGTAVDKQAQQDALSRVSDLSLPA